MECRRVCRKRWIGLAAEQVMTHAMTTSQKRQALAITGAAIALYVGFPVPPHRNESQPHGLCGEGRQLDRVLRSLESAVHPGCRGAISGRAMTVETASPPMAGQAVSARIRLVTSTGKTSRSGGSWPSPTRRSCISSSSIPRSSTITTSIRKPTGLPGESGRSHSRPKAEEPIASSPTSRQLATGRGLYAHVDLEVAGCRAGAPARYRRCCPRSLPMGTAGASS
jgi:hypothetical protein